MRNLRLNYDTLIRVSRALSKSRDPEEIIRMSNGLPLDPRSNSVWVFRVSSALTRSFS